MRNKIIAATAVATVAGIGIFLISAQNKKSPEAVESAPVTAVSGATTNKPSVDVSATGFFKKNEAAKPAAPTKVVPAEHNIWTDYEFKKDLQDYSVINGKALLLEQDKITKKDLLANRQFIASLQPLLLNVAKDTDAMHMQNAAVDLLMEALKSDSRAEALQVMNTVIADGAVESTTQPMAARQAMAGVKAEVIYNLSSAEPALDKQIEARLPGPVSQKIWKNVKQRQENNLAESQVLASSEKGH